MSTTTALLGNHHTTFTSSPYKSHSPFDDTHEPSNNFVNTIRMHNGIDTMNRVNYKSGLELSPPLFNSVKRKNRSSPANEETNPAKFLRVNTSPEKMSFSQFPTRTLIAAQKIDEQAQATTPNSAITIDVKHFEQLAIDLIDVDGPSPILQQHAPSQQQKQQQQQSEDSYDGYSWLGTGPSTQFFPQSLMQNTSPRSPTSSSDEDDLTEIERLRRENEDLKRKLVAVSQIAIDTILNQPKLSEAGMTNDQIKQSRKEAVAAVAAACGISKSRAQKEAKRRWLEGKEKDDLIHHYQVTTNNKTKRTIIGILKKRNEVELVKELKKDLKCPKKQELDS